MSDDLDEYQKRAKKKLRKHKEKMAKEKGKEPMNKREWDNLNRRLRDLEYKIKGLKPAENRLKELDVKFEGLAVAAQGMCDTLDKLIGRLAAMTGPEGDVGKKIIEGMEADMEAKVSEIVEDVFYEVVKRDDSSVRCDLCNKDWTESNVSGGIMFAGKSCCPECEPGMEEKALREGAEHYITARGPQSLSYSDWTTKIIRPLEQVRGAIPGVDIRTLGEWQSFKMEDPHKPKKPGRWEPMGDLDIDMLDGGGEDE